jgi:hypothetical protein
MLKPIFLAMLWGVLIPADVRLQEKAQRETKLVKRAEIGCGYSCNQELAIDLGGVHGDQPGDVVAVRFCSKLPLPMAFATTTSPPWYVFSILTDNYRYTPERLLFLRSADCVSSQPAAATEYWVVPKGAPLPPHLEAVKPCRLVYDSLAGDESLPGERGYKSELRRLVRKLRANSNAVGVVQGFYINRPQRSLKRRMLESERFLERSGLPSGRYLVLMMHWTGEYGIDPPEPQPKYPNVFTVEVKPGCES